MHGSRPLYALRQSGKYDIVRGTCRPVLLCPLCIMPSPDFRSWRRPKVVRPPPGARSQSHLPTKLVHAAWVSSASFSFLCRFASTTGETQRMAARHWAVVTWRARRAPVRATAAQILCGARLRPSYEPPVVPDAMTHSALPSSIVQLRDRAGGRDARSHVPSRFRRRCLVGALHRFARHCMRLPLDFGETFLEARNQRAENSKCYTLDTNQARHCA
ncbi:hypothetical protein BV20DRAFT_964797 [Pilatotrama ljubarskyi]|nr:hypothetical protein BV20DRAFT_964797 [Pilatotrama ljubarskyi]